MEELTYQNYRHLINQLKKDSYTFANFSKVKFSNEQVNRTVLLRHDIDLSLEKALEMAEIESELGVSATYFLFLRSPFYNVFSKSAEKIIHRIIELQHFIGLHFDCAKYENISISQMTYQIKKEIDFLQDFYQIKLDGVSFHRPLSLEFFSKLELANYPHSYEPYFMNNFKYLSDSRAIWRFGHPLLSESYLKKENFHLLTHPIWWNHENTEDVVSLDKFKSMYDSKFKADLYAELKGFWDAKKVQTNEG